MKLRFTAGALCAMLTVGGCGILERGNDQSSDAEGQVVEMNMQEAADHADGILDRTLRAVEPGVEWTHDETITSSCTDAVNNSTGKGTVSRNLAVMTVISNERRGSFLGVVERFWKKSGYRVINVNKSARHPAIYVATQRGFRVRLLFGYRGQAFFQVMTPCADKSSVAAPATKVKGTDYSGQDIPTPNHNSDFWSAKTTAPSKSQGADRG